MLVTYSVEKEIVQDFDKAIKKVNQNRDKYSKLITKSSVVEKSMLSFIKKHNK